MAEQPPGSAWSLPPARWPWQRSLQHRILFAYGAVFLVVLVLLMVVIGRVVYRAVMDAAEHTLEVEVFLAANALEDPLSGYAAEFEAFERHEAGSGQDDEAAHARELLQPSQRLQQVAALLASGGDKQVAILDTGGNVVGHSQVSPATMPNQLAQPEVRAALLGLEPRALRVDSLTGELSLFAAAPIQQGSRILGVVQFSRPVEKVEETLRPLFVSLVAAGLLALLGATLLGAGLGRRLVRPVRRLEQASLAMAAGNLSQEVPIETSDELGALALAFNTMASEVRHSMDRQRQFVGNASHELRTPLTNIKLRSEALLGGAQDDPAVRTRYLIEIDQEADHLAKLAANLLDLSRLDELTAAPQAALEPVDIHPILVATIEAMEPHAQKAGLTLAVDLSEHLPFLPIRSSDVKAIVTNLLDNAIKYTPAGGKVDLRAWAENGCCLIRVEDTGLGIPDEDLPHIFERFYQVDKARSRGTATRGRGSGAGLGLSIVKTMVEEYGGTVTVDSVPGQGTAFVVAFPAIVES